MKYAYDFEFIENGETIEPISIGIVSEDNKTFYNVFSDFNLTRAWRDEWLRDNVLLKIWQEFGCHRNPKIIEFNITNYRQYIIESTKTWSKAVIKRELLDFFGNDSHVELWGYYSAYDHVCLAQLWGRMIDLPPNIPMYTKDLKQELDRLGISLNTLPKQDNEHNALADAQWIMKVVRNLNL